MKEHPLETLMHIYLSEKDIIKGTYELYHTVLKQYITYLKDHEILYATTQDLINYQKYKKNQGYSNGWIYHHMHAIKGLYRYLKDNQLRLNLPEIYRDDIALSIKNAYFYAPNTSNVLTLSDAKKLLICAKNNRKYIWHYRDYAIIYLMITTGLRSIEIRRAKIKDLIHLEKQVILEIQGKGRKSKDAYVKITPGVEAAIHDYLNKRKDSNPYLFISHSMHTEKPYLSRGFYHEMFKRVFRDCQLTRSRVTPHGLRHTTATLNMMRGGTLDQTKRLLRHSHASTTMIYLDHASKENDMHAQLVEAYMLEESYAWDHDLTLSDLYKMIHEA